MKYIIGIFISIFTLFTHAVKAQTTPPLIKFDKSSYDFGTVKEGDTVVYEYKFTNTGSQPLLIYKAEVACNCTSAEWPKRFINPGQSGVIKVIFKSKDNIGAINKQIYVSSNADMTSYGKKLYELTLTGQVK
jgi:hypothetical protein